MSARRGTPLSERIAAGVVGAAALGGTVYGVATSGLPADLLVPGVVLATIWTVLGVRTTLPLVPTPSGLDARLGLKILRARRRWALAGVVAWFPLVMLASRQAPRDWIYTAMILVSLPSIGLFLTWTLSACPFCRRHVYLRQAANPGLRPPNKTCVNCFAPLKS